MNRFDSAPTAARGNDTLRDVLRSAARDGFREQFIATEAGEIRCGNCQDCFEPTSLAINGFSRLEGASDVADELLVIMGSCPECRSLGTLVCGYGPNASDADVAVLPGLDLRFGDRSNRVEHG